MIKSLVVAAALTIGLAGYAFAQNTERGLPPAPLRNPAPGSSVIPGRNPRPDGSHSK